MPEMPARTITAILMTSDICDADGRLFRRGIPGSKPILNHVQFLDPPARRYAFGFAALCKSEKSCNESQKIVKGGL